MKLLQKSIQLDFYDRNENCEIQHTHEVTKGNVIIGNQFYNYRIETHSDYAVYSERNHPHAITNTRFQLLDGQKNIVITWFANLNWKQRSWIRIKRKNAWFHDKTNISLVISFSAIVLAVIALFLGVK